MEARHFRIKSEQITFKIIRGEIIRKKYAWVWNIKEECIDEYVDMHKNPWNEVVKEHIKAGIRNYSIFRDGTQFIYYFECKNLKKAFEHINNSMICNKWNSITSKMVTRRNSPRLKKKTETCEGSLPRPERSVTC